MKKKRDRYSYSQVPTVKVALEASTQMCAQTQIQSQTKAIGFDTNFYSETQE